MAHISLRDLDVQYKIYGSETTGLADGGASNRGAGTMAVRGDHIIIQALQDIHLDVPKGVRLALIGRNGSGKTTLLKTLAGIYKPSRGSCVVDGRVEALLNIWLGISPEATGWRNLELRGLLDGKNYEQAKHAAKRIGEMTELGNYLNLPVKTYSAGMMSRLVFSLAADAEPDVLLMDEWIGAGDASFQDLANERLLQMIGKSGIVVMCSHNNALLRQVCTHGLWLDAGRIVHYADIDTVLDGYEVGYANPKAFEEAARQQS